MSVVTPLLLLGCGGDSSSSESIVGVWSTKEVNGSQTSEVFLIVNADKTHQWLGRTTVTNGSNTVSTDGPCGTGHYVFNDGTLTLTTDYVEYALPGLPGDTTTPAKKTVTKTQSFGVELVGNTMRLNKSIIYGKASRPTGNYCN